MDNKSKTDLGPQGPMIWKGLRQNHRGTQTEFTALKGLLPRSCVSEAIHVPLLIHVLRAAEEGTQAQTDEP